MCWWIGWITYLSGTLCRCCTISIHFRQQHNFCVQFKLPMIFLKWYGVFTLPFFPRMSGKKNILTSHPHAPLPHPPCTPRRPLMIPSAPPRPLRPLRLREPMNAACKNWRGASSGPWQRIARRNREQNGRGWTNKLKELTCKTWDWSNLIISYLSIYLPIYLSIALSIYMYIYIYDVHITGKLTWCSWCNWDLNY